jgi:tetratricopeptide (TPR) repeat protein
MRGRLRHLRTSGILGRLALALGVAFQTVGCRSSALEHWSVGQLELRSGQTDRAISSLEKSKALDPDFAPSYLALAAAKAKTGDLPAVAENLQEYLRRNPEHAAAELYLAECQSNLGDDASARRSFEAFLISTDRQRDKHAGRRIHAHERLAELADRRGDAFEEDLHAGAALLEDAARRELPPVDEAASRRKAEQLVAALQLLKRAKALKPADPEVKRQLSAVLAMMGEDPQPTIEKALVDQTSP